MSGAHTRPAFASDDWMLEQQMRAELEAEAWRRLRRELALPPPPQAPAAAPAPAPERPPRRANLHATGNAVLKGLVRFGMAALGAYLAYLAGVDGNLGEFEIWLAMGAAFLVTLSLTMLRGAHVLVQLVAEIARWALIIAAVAGVAWLTFQLKG
ncbi:MAG: hypothetical protein R3C25_02920 [Hyphomonadaceae bacterium]